MTEVVEFKRPEQPPEPPESKFGNDEFLLRMCAEWRACRAQQQKNWAENQAADLYGTLPSRNLPELDMSPLQHMREIENVFADWEPRTMLLARELLRVCITILAHHHEDPESVLAAGPALEIIRNVVGSLDYCDGEMKIGSKGKAA